VSHFCKTTQNRANCRIWILSPLRLPFRHAAFTLVEGRSWHLNFVARSTVPFCGQRMSQSKTVQRWSKTSVQGLVRHSSGTSYARLYAGGKEGWKSMKTSVLEVAKKKLREEQRESAGEP
jgi:hypothetical protein